MPRVVGQAGATARRVGMRCRPGLIGRTAVAHLSTIRRLPLATATLAPTVRPGACRRHDMASRTVPRAEADASKRAPSGDPMDHARAGVEREAIRVVRSRGGHGSPASLRGSLLPCRGQSYTVGVTRGGAGRSFRTVDRPESTRRRTRWHRPCLKTPLDVRLCEVVRTQAAGGERTKTLLASLTAIAVLGALVVAPVAVAQTAAPAGGGKRSKARSCPSIRQAGA